MWLEPTDLFWNKFRGALFEKLGNEYAEDLKTISNITEKYLVRGSETYLTKM